MKKIIGLGVLLTFVCLAPSVQAQDWHRSKGRGQANYHSRGQRGPANWGHQNYHRWQHRPARWGHHNYQPRRYHQAQRWRHQPRWHNQSPRWGYHNYQRWQPQQPRWGQNNYHHQRSYMSQGYQPVRGEYAQQANRWQNSSQDWVNSE